MPTLDLQTLTDRISANPPVKAHAVPVPEFGKDAILYVAELTADERDLRLEIGFEEHRKAVAEEKKAAGLRNGAGNPSVIDESNVGLRAWVAAACLCNENREFLCADVIAISKTCEMLGKQHSGVITRLFKKAQDVNAVSQAELESIEKN